MGQAPTPPPQPPTTGWGLFWWIGILDGRSRLYGSQNEADINAAAGSHLQSVFGTTDDRATQATSGSRPSAFRDQYRVGYSAGREHREEGTNSPAGRTNPSPSARPPPPPRPERTSPPEEYRRASVTQINDRRQSPPRTSGELQPFLDHSRWLTSHTAATSVASASGSRRAQSASPNRQRTPSSDPRRYGFAALGWQDGYSNYRRSYQTLTDVNPGFSQAIGAFSISTTVSQFLVLQNQYNAAYRDGLEASSSSSGGPPPAAPHIVTANAFMRQLSGHDRIYYGAQPGSNAANDHLRAIYGQSAIPEWRRTELVTSYQSGLGTPGPPSLPPPPSQPRVPRSSTSPPNQSRPSSAGGPAAIVQPIPRRVGRPPAIASPGASRSTSRSSFSNRDLYAGPSPPPPRRVGPTNPANPSRSSSSSPFMATQPMQLTGSGGSPRPTSASSTPSRVRSDSSLASLVRPGYVYVDAGTQVSPGGVPIRRPQQVRQRRSLQNLPSASGPTSGLTADSVVSGILRRPSRSPSGPLTRYAPPGRGRRR